MAATVRPEDIQEAVRHMFDRVAERPDDTYRFKVGPDLARRVGYPDDVLAASPPHSADAFTGLTYLHPHLQLHGGEAVLDLGCGRGLDCFISAHAVGPTGSVTGLDLSEAMIERARASAENFPTVSFQRGEAEALPFPDAIFDVVYANGILNLCPDKPRIVQEMHRIIKRGGRVVVAEITFTEPTTERQLQTTDDWFR
jgi:arsenite methyltransferase